MRTKKACVIGTNVSNSLSPAIFQYWFDKYNIDAEYGYIKIKEEDFDKEIKSIFKKGGLCGLNVTTPYKERIISHLTGVDKHATKIGAVNCVTINDNFIKGINTDWTGFKDSLDYFEDNRHDKIKTKRDVAIVIGYGGSAKAIIYSLKSLCYKKIMVFNRTFEKIKSLKNIQGDDRNIIEPLKLEKLPIKAPLASLIVNTVPDKDFIGRVISSLRSNEDYRNKSNILGYDIVYKPETNFVRCFMSYNGIRGIYLLVHQAAPCFHKWFGVKPKIDQDIFKTLTGSWRP